MIHQRLVSAPVSVQAAVWLVMAAGLGAVLSLALAPLHLVVTVPFALCGIAVLLLRVQTVRQAMGLGWAFGFGYFLFALSWIVEPFQVDAARHAWMAPFALIFLAGGLALFWGAAFGLTQRFTRGNLRILGLIGFWSLAEFLRAYALTGFPWAAFGQFWIETPLSAVLPLVGPHGLALVTLLVCLPLALLRRHLLIALVPAVLLCLWVWAQAGTPKDIAFADKVVRLVQPNAPQDEKWHPDLRWEFVRRQVAFSADLPRPDLIVWPETAVPQLLNHAADTLAQISAAAGGVPILLGIQREDAGAYFNSAILLDEAGAPVETYDKAHLVPFGEYVPFGDVMARIGVFGLAAQAGSGYSAGARAQVLSSPVGRFLPLICYEAVFPQDLLAATERPEFLVQITNDAWFGTYSGPQQHLVQARMRAAEQGLPMVRVANTGESAMIDPFGRILDSIPLGTAGYIDAILPAPRAATLYSRSGDLPILAFCVLLTVLAICGRRPLVKL